MAKLVTSDLANLDNPVKAVAVINGNFARVEEALENTLSRDGSTPNGMDDDLDMDGNRIVNLPPPTNDTEPARHGDIQTYVTSASDSAAAALASEQNAAASEAIVVAEAADVDEIWEDVQVYGTPAFYDIAVFAGGLLSDNEVIFRYSAPRGFSIASGASGSASAGTAATASNTITIKKNGSSIGTAVWAIGATTATLSITSTTTFVAGDVLSFENQASADATLASVAITLVASRQP